MKEQIMFHRKQYLKNNRAHDTFRKDPWGQSKIILFFLPNNQILRGPFPHCIFLLTLASRFRVKTLYQSYRAEECGYELHATL